MCAVGGLAEAAATAGGLLLDDEVADWLQVLRRTQCPLTTTAALKISLADGLCGAGGAAQTLHQRCAEVKNKRNAYYPVGRATSLQGEIPAPGTNISTYSNTMYSVGPRRRPIDRE